LWAIRHVPAGRGRDRFQSRAAAVRATADTPPVRPQRASRAPATRRSLDARRGSGDAAACFLRGRNLPVWSGKGGRRREVGMDEWGGEQLRPWLYARAELPVGPLFGGRLRVSTEGRAREARLHEAPLDSELSRKRLDACRLFERASSSRRSSRQRTPTPRGVARRVGSHGKPLRVVIESMMGARLVRRRAAADSRRALGWRGPKAAVLDVPARWSTASG